jgi:hypothetical protein
MQKKIRSSEKVSAHSRILWVLIKETAVVGRLLRARPKSCTFTPRLVARAWPSQSDQGKPRQNKTPIILSVVSSPCRT